MRYLVLYIFHPPEGKGSPFPNMSCVFEDEEPDYAVVHTLLDVVQELSSPEVSYFKDLIARVKSNKYDRQEFETPQWAGNACTVWFGEPVAGPNHVLISNHYVPEYSEEEGNPQRFTLEQLETTLIAWRKYIEEVSRVGLSQMNQQKFALPE